MGTQTNSLEYELGYIFSFGLAAISLFKQVQDG